MTTQDLGLTYFAEAKIKTDKVDSRVLAELLRCDYNLRTPVLFEIFCPSLLM
jgi:hypothetical protein